jgi:hypothetical protein
MSAAKLMDKDKINLFDFLKSVSETKEELYEYQYFEKDYPPFMINRFLSASQDTLFFAYIMSQFDHLPKKLQYSFYLLGIDKKKRYFQYSGKGKDKSKDLKTIVEYYQCSKEQGMEYLKLLSEDQIKQINKIYEKRIKKGNLK